MIPEAAVINSLTGKFIVGILLLVRVMGLFASGPFFRNSAIPVKVRILFSILITVVLTGTFAESQPPIDLHLWNLAFLVFKETVVGILLGLSANAVFWAARTAGGLIDFEMGYQTGVMFGLNDTPTLIGEIHELVTLMLFLMINGHHFLIEGIFASVRAVPITTFSMSESTVTMLSRLGTTVFLIGIKMAAPVLAALFLMNLTLVILSRIAPQTNIFILSFQLKILVGLAVLFVSVPIFVMVTKYTLGNMQSEIMKMIMTLNPANV